ncbi:TlpA family protein disulfide reductase [Candidatus Curtissbacteria bacterium]|nr:TlpA family protein disulfide reductase [Candidatus Curtissbacteria bacterium]
MNSKAIIGIGIVIVLVVLGFFVFRDSRSVSQSTGESTSPRPVSEQAPDFSLESFEGEIVSLANQQGKAVFVDFWAAWCPFCVEEMTEIEKISQEFKEELVVLGIHRSETEDIETGSKFAKERGVTYPLLKDTDGSVYKAYTGGRNFMPTAAFINKEGKVIKFLYGPKTQDQMRQYAREALGQTN